MVVRGMARQAHTDKCRKRFEKEMSDDERVKASREREYEFIAKEIERNAKAQTANDVTREQQANNDAGTPTKRTTSPRIIMGKRHTNEI